MSREKKTQLIEEIMEAITKCDVGVLTDYRGLTSPEITNLRRRLRDAGIEFKVVKNTLARFAAERAGMSDLSDYLEGPIAIAFGYGDIAGPAKILTSYSGEAVENLAIKGGFLGDRLLTPADVKTLSTLPSREIMLARVMGQMQSPVSALLGSLSSPIRGMIGLLQARIQQLEGE